MPVILLQMPEPRTRRLLRRFLEDQGLTVRTAPSPGESLALSGEFRPGAMLIGDGPAGLRPLRAAGLDAPALVLLPEDSLAARKEAFAAGADCWLTRPIDPEETALLLWALCRRWGSGAPSPLRWEDATLEEGTRELSRPGQAVPLSPREYDLLALFLANPRRVFSRQELLDRLWEPASESGPRAVDVAIRRLRARLGEGWGFRIEAVRGLGYRLEPVRDGEALSARG